MGYAHKKFFSLVVRQQKSLGIAGIDYSGFCGAGTNRPGPNGLVEVTGTWPTFQAAADLV